MVPMDYLLLEPGRYILYAYSSSSGPGANNCQAAVINDVATTGTCFGYGPIDLENNKTLNKTDDYSTPKSFNYVYLKVPNNQTINFNLRLKLTKINEEGLKIINKGNVYSLPQVTVYGTGDLTLGVNGKSVFTINLWFEEYITIDATNLEASKDGVLKNRLITGNYDNFKLNPGVNFINYTGIVEKITLKKYSRWL